MKDLLLLFYLLLVLGSNPSHRSPLTAQIPFVKMGKAEQDQSISKRITHLWQQQQDTQKKEGREIAVEADKNPTHPLQEIRMPNATRGVSPLFPRIQILRTSARGSSRISNLSNALQEVMCFSQILIMLPFESLNQHL